MRVWLATLAALAAISFSHPSAAQTAPIPVEAFGNLPAVADAAISPDGKRIALAQFIDGRALLSVIDLEQRRRVYAGAFDNFSQLRGVGWADDTYLTYQASRAYNPNLVLPAGVRWRGHMGRLEYYRTGVVDVQTQHNVILSTNPDDPWADFGARLVSPIEGDPGFGRMIGSARSLDTIYPNVYRVDFSNGRARLAGIHGVSETTTDYVLNPHGDVVARTDVDQRTNHWRFFVYDGDAPRQLLEGDSELGEGPDVRGLMPDGRLAVIDKDEGDDVTSLYALDPASGAREKIYSHDGADVSSTLNDPWTRVVIGVHWAGKTSGNHYFDEAMQRIEARLDERFSQGSAHIMSWSRDKSRVLVYGELGLDGGSYYLYAPASDQLQFIAALYPALENAQLGVRQEITYPARDGTRIPAYLTLPAVADAHNLPLVVLVHGGPHGYRDTLDFDWWAGFLASRGYAVLQPNYRGSGGYGEAWKTAGYHQWGDGVMQTDVEDGVVALGRSGVIDPARACIVGASYGGYAAPAGATLTPDRYRCAASVAGLSDLVVMIDAARSRTGQFSFVADFWQQSIGDRSEDIDHIRAVSPARLADRVHIPVLLIHGVDDSVVPISQSRAMRDALRAAGKNVQYVELHGDDHWLSDADTRIQMLQELEAFLAQNLGTSATATSPAH